MNYLRFLYFPGDDLGTKDFLPSYFISCLMMETVFGKLPKKVNFCICFFVSTIGFMLSGPSLIFGLHNDFFISKV